MLSKRLIGLDLDDCSEPGSHDDIPRLFGPLTDETLIWMHQHAQEDPIKYKIRLTLNTHEWTSSETVSEKTGLCVETVRRVIRGIRQEDGSIMSKPNVGHRLVSCE